MVDMPSIVVVGAQWGDEGKGKIIDYLAKYVDVIVRYNGGANAGHTVNIKGRKYVFHLLPSGALYSGKTLVIGNGVVVDVAQLLDEIRTVEEAGYRVNLILSNRAHVVMPWHKLIDKASGGKIGTTGRGIGPTYTDKMWRKTAVRISDLISRNFRDKLREILKLKEHELKHYGIIGDSVEEYLEEVYSSLSKLVEAIKPYIDDVSLRLNEFLDQGKWVLFEGAQGTMLDVDHGTYPYVTSSNTISGGACTGAGVPPTRIDVVLGVAKAYTTRVGKGPMPTEIRGEIAEHIREKGGEYGATTGRPRRIGWLDLVVLKYARRINGFSNLALTKLDVLSGIKTIKIAIGYELDGRKIDYIPASSEEYARVKPIYVEFPGWRDISRDEWREIARSGVSTMPKEAIKYVNFIREELNVDIAIISVGPSREETILLKDVFNIKEWGRY